MSREAIQVFCCLALMLSTSYADEWKTDKTECVNDLVSWCDSTKFSNDYGTSNMIIGNVVCYRNNYGTKCSRDGWSWLSCWPRGTMKLNGVVLGRGSTDGVPDDVCDDRNAAFCQYDIPNMGFDAKAFSESMNKMGRELGDSMNQMGRDLGASMNQMGRDLSRSLGNMFSGAGWPFNRRR